MSATARTNDILMAWNLLLPQVAAPSELWLRKICAFTDVDIERGLRRALKKFGTGSIHSGDVERYVLGICRNESAECEWNIQDQNPASRW
jgi:hypothetical protein